MCDEGFLESSDLREGYFKPLGQPWRLVRYANVDGLAIFEGCIILGETAVIEASSPKIAAQARDNPILLQDASAQVLGVARKGKQYLWPGRTVAYVLSSAFPDPARIHQAIAHWHAKTTIRFVARTAEQDYVEFREITSGCASGVGRLGGRQEIVLRTECTTGNIIHELGHAIGLWHEQSRADREDFVKVDFDQIAAGKSNNFDQHIIDGTDLGDYDFGSIMHYPLTAFGVNGAQTIFPIVPVPAGITIGQRVSLSLGDIIAVEKLYAGEAVPGG